MGAQSHLLLSLFPDGASIQKHHTGCLWTVCSAIAMLLHDAQKDLCRYQHSSRACQIFVHVAASSLSLVHMSRTSVASIHLAPIRLNIDLLGAVILLSFGGVHLIDFRLDEFMEGWYIGW